MKTVNKVEISGRLTGEPKYFSGVRSDGTTYHITSFDIGHTHPAGKGRNPQAYFFKCTSFREIALALKELHKGDPIIVKGFLKYAKYNNKNGGVSHLTQIVIQDFEKGWTPEPEPEQQVQEATDYEKAIKDSGLEGLDDLVF